jgi:hypothetical protein
MIGDRETIARLQSDFYRDSYYRIINWLFFEIIIMLLLISAIIYHIIVHPVQHYYATTSQGMLLPLHPSQ